MRDTGRNFVYATQEAPWNQGERMLEHIGLVVAPDPDEYRQYAVHEDFQDTVWGLSDTSAAIAERYNYTDPYGMSNSDDSGGTGIGEFATQVFHRKRMHGGFVEQESEFYDYRNRWIMVGLGAWSSADALVYVDTLNMYAGFASDPLSLTDQFGLDATWSTCPASLLATPLTAIDGGGIPVLWGEALAGDC
jgi:RHS repeat-associated protein